MLPKLVQPVSDERLINLEWFWMSARASRQATLAHANMMRHGGEPVCCQGADSAGTVAANLHPVTQRLDIENGEREVLNGLRHPPQAFTEHL